MNENTKQYQIMMVFPPVLNPKELEEAIGRTKQIIIDHEGSFSENKITPEPQLKKLSYPINKYEEAFYLTINFSLPMKSMEEVNKQLNLGNDLIRYVITMHNKKRIIPEQTIDYNKMIEKVEPIRQEPIKQKSILKKPIKRIIKSEIEDLDKKLEEILSE